MANYYCRTRTNYFHVKDPDAFRAFMAEVKGNEDDVLLREGKDADGNLTFVFTTGGRVIGIVPAGAEVDYDEDECNDEFIAALQEHVAPNDAIIITEVGWEGFRYLVGGATIITSSKVEYLSLSDEVKKTAKSMLDNPDWSTMNEY